MSKSQQLCATGNPCTTRCVYLLFCIAISLFGALMPMRANAQYTTYPSYSQAMTACQSWVAANMALLLDGGLQYDPTCEVYPYEPNTIAIYDLTTAEGFKAGFGIGYGWFEAWYFPGGIQPDKNAGNGAGCDGGTGGSGTCPQSKGAPVVADPINVATGNKFIEEDDFIDVNNWLTFRRFYNSVSDINFGATGSQWRHSFDRSLAFVNSAATSVLLNRPDGKQELFNKTNGVWTTSSDISDVLTENDNAQGVATSYTIFVAALRNYETYSTTGVLLTVTDETGQGVTLSYSTTSTPTNQAPAAGMLLTVTDPRGRELVFTYNSNGNLHQVTLPDGGALTYTQSSSGTLESVQYPDGSNRQYIYNESSMTGGASLPNALTGVIDEANVRYQSTSYNSSSQATSDYLAGGVNNTQITYNTDGTATLECPLGFTVTMGFSTVNGLYRVASLNHPCGPQCGQPWQARTYDANGNLQSATDFNNNITATTYNGSGLLTQQIDAQGQTTQRTTTLSWDPTLLQLLQREVLNASGAVVANTTWVNNSMGEPLARCDIDPANSADSGYSCSSTGAVPAGVRRTTYSYCTTTGDNCPLPGLLLSVTGPRTDLTQTTSYSYYTAASATNCGMPGAGCYQPGDLYQVTDALGHVTTIASYDADGRITRMTDPNGVNTDLTYYPRGWLKTRAVGDAQTSFTYTAYGAVQTITDPDGVTTTFGYDTAHRLTKITDALGNYIQYILDAAGDKTGESVYNSTGTLHKNLTRTFNTLGQLTTVVDGLNHTVFNASASTSYDANGNLVQSTDGLGFQRQLGYDALNRLQQTLDNYNGSDPATQNTTTGYTYDSLDRPTQVTDPSNLATTYSYDGLSDATGQVSPDTGTTRRTFDAAGNVLTRTDAKGVTATNTYDALDRLISTSYPDTTQNVTYSYDDPNSTTGCSSSNPTGRLTRIIESAVTTIYCYDAQGSVIQKQQITSAGTDTTGYSYTTAERLSGIIYPSGTLVSYTRDGDGRVQSVSVTPSEGSASTAVSSVTYQPFGPVSGYTLGNGQAITRAYDANYRLTDLTSPAFNLHVARDAMGDITAIGNAPGANPATETYVYDPLYRLTSITDGSTVEESATYNPTGDRLTKNGSGLATGAYTYNTGTHQLNAIGNAVRTVDADGNTTAITQAGSIYGFGYSDRNRMTVAQLAGSTVATYTYNALNERVRKVLGTVIERYDYNEAAQMLGEYGTNERDYVWMDGIPVANVDTSGSTSTIAYVTADQLGTPRAIATSAGATEWTLPYQGNPWNEVAPTTTGYTYNLRFPGQYFDVETGLNYNGHRDYDTATGREIESDPKGLFGGQISTYAYGNNNPLSYVDPSGLQSTALCANPVNAAACAAAGMSPATGSGVSATAIGGAAAAAAAGSLTSDSKTCPDDDCAALIAKIEAQVKGLETKYNNMLEDEHSLYTKAYDTRMSPPDDVWGTWEGHVTYYDGLQAGLNKMISQAEAKGCPVPADAYDWAQRPAPIQPNNL